MLTHTCTHCHSQTQRHVPTHKDTCKYAPTASSSYTLTHRFAHKDIHVAHARTHIHTVVHGHTQNKDTHANIPPLCSAGGILTGLRCQPIKRSHYDSLFKQILLASISRHSNIFTVIRSKCVLVHFTVNGSGALEHTVA